jgi:hypothetical protein
LAGFQKTIFRAWNDMLLKTAMMDGQVLQAGPLRYSEEEGQQLWRKDSPRIRAVSEAHWRDEREQLEYARTTPHQESSGKERWKSLMSDQSGPDARR